MSLHHNMFPHFLIYPQIVLLLGEVRRGRRASSSPPTRYTAEPVSFLAFQKSIRGRREALGKSSGAPENQEWEFSFLLNEYICKHNALPPCFLGSRAEGCGGHPGRSNQQPLSRPAPPGSARPLAFPGSHQRGTRAPSLPAAGGGKRKGLLFFSLPFCGSPGC